RLTESRDGRTQGRVAVGEQETAALPRRPPHRNRWTPWPVSGLASEACASAFAPSHADAQWRVASARLAYRCGGSAGMAASWNATTASPASRFSPAGERPRATTKRRPLYGNGAQEGLPGPGRTRPGSDARSVEAIAAAGWLVEEAGQGGVVLALHPGVRDRRGVRGAARRRQLRDGGSDLGHQLLAAFLRDVLPVAVLEGALERVEHVEARPEPGALDAHEGLDRAGGLQVLARAQSDLAQPGRGLGADVAQ